MSLYRAGPEKAVATDLAKRNLDQVAVLKIRWDKAGSQPTEISPNISRMNR